MLKDKRVTVLISWIVVIGLLLLILPINELSNLVSVFNLDALGIILFGAVIFALGGIYLLFKNESIQNMSQVENNASQLRYEVNVIHTKIDEIKKLVED